MIKTDDLLRLLCCSGIFFRLVSESPFRLDLRNFYEVEDLFPEDTFSVLLSSNRENLSIFADDLENPDLFFRISKSEAIPDALLFEQDAIFAAVDCVFLCFLRLEITLFAIFFVYLQRTGKSSAIINSCVYSERCSNRQIFQKNDHQICIETTLTLQKRDQIRTDRALLILLEVLFHYPFHLLDVFSHWWKFIRVFRDVFQIILTVKEELVLHF